MYAVLASVQAVLEDVNLSIEIVSVYNGQTLLVDPSIPELPTSRAGELGKQSVFSYSNVVSIFVNDRPLLVTVGVIVAGVPKSVNTKVASTV